MSNQSTNSKKMKTYITKGLQHVFNEIWKAN
jgi:hypothetical protein